MTCTCRLLTLVVWTLKGLPAQRRLLRSSQQKGSQMSNLISHISELMKAYL